MSRYRELKREELSPEQQTAWDGIVSGPRGRVSGPFNVLLLSPALAEKAQRLGQFARYDSSLPPRLSELAILVTGRYWSAQYEWFAHRRLALEAGVSEDVVNAIRDGMAPDFDKEDERVVYNFATTLHRDKRVSDAVFEATKAVLGERGLVDLIGICGYYTLISMTLNAFRVPLPEGHVPELRQD
jgi:4-carboxymuconolactone decarboxylase